MGDSVTCLLTQLGVLILGVGVISLVDTTLAASLTLGWIIGFIVVVLFNLLFSGNRQ